MSGVDLPLPRLRQAVLVAADLESVAAGLSDALDLGEPFSDPGIAYFGLHNAVFALGDTFLEVVTPVQEGTSAGRWLSRRGGDGGYMVMFEISDLDAARERAAGRNVREVFEVEHDDIAEVHLHPADMRGAIVALSAPRPHGSWRWGGPGWQERSRPSELASVRIAVENPEDVAARWSEVLGVPAGATGVRFAQCEAEPGLMEITIGARDGRQHDPIEIGGVRFVHADASVSMCSECCSTRARTRP